MTSGSMGKRVPMKTQWRRISQLKVSPNITVIIVIPEGHMHTYIHTYAYSQVRTVVYTRVICVWLFSRPLS